ncbi:hypothetical protein [Rummeliibacillus pycnus]|uniref:hypothetical protein n=1 Tax=Rummeliibacillus pycnus TaxID=101070 RepID=UPI0037C5B336
MNKNVVSAYKQGDFDWKYISKLDYGEDKTYGITVPFKIVDENKDSYLNVSNRETRKSTS